MKKLIWLGPLLLVIGGLAAIFFPRSTDLHPGKEEGGPPWFQDCTADVGLDFTHDAGPVGNFFMPQIMGSGCALLDFDKDGRLDIFLTNMGGPKSSSTNRLYRQLPNGRFQDVSKGSGLDFAGNCVGIAVGDVNNDGWPDIAVTLFTGVKLFLNQGDGTFKDVTEAAGLHNPHWGTSAAFTDFDRDGWLDLIVVNYIDYDPTYECTQPHRGQEKQDYCQPRKFPGTVSRLYRNLGLNGPGGTLRFEDVTVSSGIGRLPGPGLGVICADFDGDGWPDIFVANDGLPNRLWINQRNGTFKEEAVLRGVAYTGMGQIFAGMGVAWGDVDGDGLMDMLVTHQLSETHTLWKQGPRGLFQDVTGPAGLAGLRSTSTGFGTLLADFDHDGALDLVIVNGGVYLGQDNVNPALPHWGWYLEHNQFFRNDGSGRFQDISRNNPDLCGTPRIARGLACGDFDGDGTLDLLVSNIADKACLYRNVTPHRGHWLMVEALMPSLRDPANPRMDRDAYGAEITVRAGDKRWMRLLHAANTYLTSSDPRAHFGLGPASQVDSIEILWPNGARERFPGGTVDRLVRLRQGQGQTLGK